MAKFNPTYEIDLDTVFDRVYGGRSSSFKRQLRSKYRNPNFKAAFGTNVVKEIRNRTLEGKDKRGRTMGSYSESYRESLEFKIYKSGATVNLKQTGAMLASLDFKSSGSKMTVNLRGSENKAKADGHITGFRGRYRRRDFLGLPKSVENDLFKTILSSFSSQEQFQTIARRQAEVTVPVEVGDQQRTQITGDLFGSIAANPGLFE